MTTAYALLIITSLVIPLISSLLAKVHWPSEVVGILSLILSFANGFFVQWSDSGAGFDWKQAVGKSIVAFFVALLARYGLWKNTQTDAKILAFPPRYSTSRRRTTHRRAA